MKTPCFVYSRKSILENYASLNRAFNKIAPTKIYYSVKTNSFAGIISVLDKCRSSFMACSTEELQFLKKQKISMSKCLFLNPSADFSELKKVKKLGVSLFVADSIEQLNILSKLKVKILIRINTNVSTKNQFRKGTSFGVTLDQLKNIDTPIVGIHNHLITQNNEIASWKKNLAELQKAVKILQKNSHKIKIVDIGGGIPIDYDIKASSLNAIVSAISPTLKQIHKLTNCSFIIEPGRYLAGKDSIFLTSVSAVKNAGQRKVAFLDSSIYNSLPDILFVGLKPKFNSYKSGKKYNYELRGCTPDSLDEFGRVNFPELFPGDIIAIDNAGAYNFYCDFLKLKKPKNYLVD